MRPKQKYVVKINQGWSQANFAPPTVLSFQNKNDGTRIVATQITIDEIKHLPQLKRYGLLFPF